MYWVVRESVRKALRRGVMNFDSQNALVENAKKIGKIKFNFDYENILKKSKILKERKEQKILSEFFH